MYVKFSLYKTPKPKDRKGRTYTHARLQPKGTKRIEDICKYVKEVSSLSPADIKGSLEILFDYISLQLSDGYNVELENFGHFSVALRSRTVINTRGREVGEAVIDGVNFRCSPRLREEVRRGRLEKQKKRIVPFPTIEERKKRMLEYLTNHGVISQRQYAELNACTRYQATKDIRTFAEEQLILPSGGGTHRVYLLAASE